MRFSKLSLRGLVGLALALSLPAAAAARLKVVATMPVFADLVRAIGGDRVKVDAVSKVLQDPHFAEPTPWSIARVSRADAFVTAGLDLELWRGPLLEAAANTRLFISAPGYVDLSVGIDLLQIPLGGVSRQQGDIHVMGNPHYFYSPTDMQVVARTLEERLIELDPAGVDRYREGGARFREQLAGATRRWETMLAPYRGQPIVPFHNAFPYFERWSGLVILDHIEPKPGINPSASHLARLTIRMKRAGVKVILHEPFYNRKFSEAVARRSGAEVVMFYSQPGKGSSGETYVEMMDANIRALVSALSRSPDGGE